MTLHLEKPDSVLLTAKQAAEILGLTERYLAMDRHTSRNNGTPPTVPYVRLGYRTIRYKRADLIALIDASRVS